jgi:hypothetical protein
MDNLSVRDSSPYGEIALFDMTPGDGAHISVETTSFPPEIFGFTPPTSPQYSTGNKPSPSHYSPAPTDLGDFPQLQQHDHVPTLPVMTDGALMPPHSNMANSQSMQNVISQQSHTQSLPALSQTSSSPPPAEMISFDFSDMPVTTATQNLSLTASQKSDQPNEFDAFLTDNFYEGTEMMGDDSFFSMHS